MFYVYILRCNDDSLYTGYTNDIDKRIEKHNLGKGARYTFTRRPVKLVYFEEQASKSDALKREYAIKQMSRIEKIKLIESKS